MDKPTDITLWDYYAARALTGLLANPNLLGNPESGSVVEGFDTTKVEEITRLAELVADMMCDERMGAATPAELPTPTRFAQGGFGV